VFGSKTGTLNGPPNLRVVDDLRGQVRVGFHDTDHRTDELVLKIRTSRELSQRVVLRLLLQGLALFQAVPEAVNLNEALSSGI
jgi:hypothetical protein